MLHKNSQTNIVGKYLGPTTLCPIVGGTGIKFGHEKPSFALVLIADNETRDGKPAVHDQLRVLLGHLQEVSKGCVLLLLLVF